MTNTARRPEAEVTTTLTPKECNRCKKIKILETDYYRNAANADGHNAACIPCVRNYLRARREALKRSLPRKLDKLAYSTAVGKAASMLLEKGLKFEDAATIAKELVDMILAPDKR